MAIAMFITIWLIIGILCWCVYEPESWHILTMLKWISWWPGMILIGILKKDIDVMDPLYAIGKWFKYHFTELPEDE